MPTAHVYRLAAWDNLVSGTWYVVPYDAVVFDYGGNYDLVNHRFIAPRTARYSVSAQILITGLNVAGWRYLYARVNGSTKLASALPSLQSSWSIITVCGLVDCVVGDYIDFYFMHNCGIDTPDIIIGHPWTFLTVCLEESN